MTDSPHPGPVHQPEAADAGAQTPTDPPADRQDEQQPNTFSELNSFRPLDVGLQDLRPLRGRPPADPGPPRLAGVHP